MKKISLNWTLSHTKNLSEKPLDEITAKVPGAVQLDYAEAKGYAPYYYGENFKQFDWMEDEYFIYRSQLDFTASPLECAFLCLEGIDYKYIVKIAGKVFAKGEGMFTPVILDVSQFSGRTVPIEVVIFPIPKAFPQPQNRSQARASCKPTSSYGWDWHPRLVPSGIWGDAYVKVIPIGSPYNLECSYRLADDYSSATVSVTCDVCGAGFFEASVISPSGEVCASERREVGEKQKETFILTVKEPEMWYPRGYGDQPLYTVKVKGCDAVIRRIGFRRSRLILNHRATDFEKNFPKGPMSAPMQLEINGVKVFAKGSNWVNTEIFPALMTNERYDELIDLACDANMNIFRMWGGQFINHEHFYERCDEKGIMIWQEFMLSCNNHPDEDHYLSVLKQEATTIIKRLRTHPCLAFWCGGNELFNSWSGMTCQSHALRLLDSLCYEHDRFTPFNMTSPLYGAAHGSYVKVVFPDNERRNGDFSHGREFLSYLKRSSFTCYTEFGCNGAATKDYILKYIMDEKDYADCRPENPVWTSHHAFSAWNESCWLGIPDVIFFFGGYESVDDLIEKSIYLQDLCYKTMFEEMRRQAPKCSMAVNWDFNEPWPCAAGNSLVSWPAHPKSALGSVKAALRSTLLSMDAPRNRYLTGDVLKADVWTLNDSPDAQATLTADVYLIDGGVKTKLATVSVPACEARSNVRGGGFEFVIPETLSERFAISIECAENPEFSSVYDLVHNLRETARSDSPDDVANEFSDFLK
ncbi:MAG: hypothetical protein IJV70_06670 [Clostridia bacterium]|nr:hypothetical protein [Clostridia bacterium]